MGNNSFVSNIQTWELKFQLEEKGLLKIQSNNFNVKPQQLGHETVTKYDAQYSELTLPQNMYKRFNTISNLFNYLKQKKDELHLEKNSLRIKYDENFELSLLSKNQQQELILQGLSNSSKQYDLVPVQPQEMKELPFKSVVLIKSQNKLGCIQSTGFFIGKNKVLSVAHSVCTKKQQRFQQALHTYVSFYKNQMIKTVKVKNHYIPNQYRTSSNEDMVKYDFAILQLQNNEQVTDDMIIQIKWNWPGQSVIVLIVGFSQILDNQFNKYKHIYHMKAKLTSKTQSIVKYAKRTKDGLSGAPLIIYDQNQNKYKVIALHQGILVNIARGLLLSSIGKNPYQILKGLFGNSSLSIIPIQDSKIDQTLIKTHPKYIDIQNQLENTKNKCEDTDMKLRETAQKLKKVQEEKQKQQKEKQKQQEKNEEKDQIIKRLQQILKQKQKQNARLNEQQKRIQQRAKQKSRIRSTGAKTQKCLKIVQLNKQGKQLISTDPDQAIQKLLACLSLVEEIYTKQSNQYLDTLNILISAYARKKQELKCLQIYQKYLNIGINVKGQLSIDYISASYNLGYYYYVLRQDQKALQCFQKVEESCFKRQNNQDIRNYYQMHQDVILFCLGDLHRLRNQQSQKCLEYFIKQLKFVENIIQSSTTANIIMNQIGVTYSIQKKSASSDQFFLYRKNRRINQIGYNNYSREDQLIIREAAFFYANGLYDLIDQKLNELKTQFYKILQKSKNKNPIQMIKNRRINKKYYL